MRYLGDCPRDRARSAGPPTSCHSPPRLVAAVICKPSWRICIGSWQLLMLHHLRGEAIKSVYARRSPYGRTVQSCFGSAAAVAAPAPSGPGAAAALATVPRDLGGGNSTAAASEAAVHSASATTAALPVGPAAASRSTRRTPPYVRATSTAVQRAKTADSQAMVARE